VDHALMNLDGKLALVTGAGSGIGRATATAFARAGAHLVVCDVDAARVRDVAAELGDRCVLARALDVGDREAMAALADEVHALQPALDVLVNNAGVAVGGGILDTPLESWDWLLRVNQMGVIHGCHFFATFSASRFTKKRARSCSGRPRSRFSRPIATFRSAASDCSSTTAIARGRSPSCSGT
jgi:NAD(P)-dependent dehydrogenase (short-subunit alcohol dehydrogenase family)